MKTEENNNIPNPKLDVKIKVEENRLIESCSDSKSNNISNPRKESAEYYDSSHTNPIVED